MEPVNPYIVVHSGEPFDLVAPTVESVSIEDIATSLARTPRWNGHTKLPFVVAQHSVNVSHLVYDLTYGDLVAAFYALLHDAHEAYIGDIATPVKKALIHLGCPPEALEKLASNIDKAIFPAFGLSEVMPRSVREAVKEADLIAGATEYKVHMPDGSPKVDRFEAVSVPRRVERMVLGEEEARDYFMGAFEYLRHRTSLEAA